MVILSIVCFLQVAVVVAVSLLLRAARRSATRLAGVISVLCLAPLMALGAIWPSVHTIAALCALPALVIWVAALVWPTVVRRAAVRWYGIASLGLAVAASVLQIWWLGNCHEVTLIVPDGFKGTVSLVKDSKSGVDLKAMDYRVTFSPTAEVRIRDDQFLFRCYTAKVRSVSGVELPFRDAGVTAGGPRDGPSGQQWSTEFEGTSHQWIVE